MADHSLVEKLEQHGYKLTMPRLKVLASVVGRDNNFTAEEICAELPGIGRATVYRTLKLLVENGLLCKLTLQDGSPRYSFSETGHHHHLVCVSCGSVKVFRQSMIEQVLSQLESSDNGTLVGHRIEVYVLCPTCQASGDGAADTDSTVRATTPPNLRN